MPGDAGLAPSTPNDCPLFERRLPPPLGPRQPEDRIPQSDLPGDAPPAFFLRDIENDLPAMYDGLPKSRRRARPVTDNAGSPKRQYREYCRLVARDLNRGGDALQSMRSATFEYLVNPNCLFLAFSRFFQVPGVGYGPDESKDGGTTRREAWDACRALSATLRSGTYRITLPQKVERPKASGGTRTISIYEPIDQVVAKAVHLVLEPFFRQSAFTYSMPGRGGHLQALSDAFGYVRDENREVWVANDLVRAFDRVPRGRLFSLLCRFPDELLALMDELTQTGSRNGLPQGLCLSPLLMDIYLAHHLDTPWERRYSRPRLIRYVDDVLVLCPTLPAAAAADAFVRKCLEPTRMRLKYEAKDGIFDLRRGDEVEWLGFRIRRGKRLYLEFRFHNKAWQSLDLKLQQIHDQEFPNLAPQVIGGWLESYGPCLPFVRFEHVLNRLAARAAERGCQLDHDTLLHRWAKSWNCFQASFGGITERPARSCPLARC